MRSLTNFPGRSEETDQLLNESTSSSHAAERYFERSSRVWTVGYVCVVSIQAIFILGFSLGFSSPVLSELVDEKNGYSSLRKTTYQDVFSVSFEHFNYINSHLLNKAVCHAIYNIRRKLHAQFYKSIIDY